MVTRGWSCADLTVKGDRGIDAVRGLSLEVRGGEIVGIAGVSGNGQRELAEAIAGLRPAGGGSIDIEGTELVGLQPAEVRRAGLGFVPEERMRDGVVPAFSVAENLLLIDNAAPQFARWGFLRARAIRRHSEELVAEFDVKTPSLDTPARNLSGGNIQKLILARELSARPRVLLAAQPTRGVDVGAAHYIHERLMRAARRRYRDPHRLGGPRRGPLALRSRARDVRGRDHRRGEAAGEHARGARPDDGRHP